MERHQNGCMEGCQLFGKTLSGKVALITGSSKGIGKAIATQLAKEGATIILHYFMDELSTLKLKRLTERIRCFCVCCSSKFSI